MTGTSPQITQAKQAAFLQSLADTGLVKLACAEAGVSKSSVYAWRRADAQFRALWDEALDHAGQVLAEEARRRALEGTAEPVYFKGEQVGSVIKYSDQLLMFLLKGAMPEKYRERVEVSGSVDIASAMLAARGRVGQAPAAVPAEVVTEEQRAEALADLRGRLEH